MLVNSVEHWTLNRNDSALAFWKQLKSFHQLVFPDRPSMWGFREKHPRQQKEQLHKNLGINFITDALGLNTSTKSTSSTSRRNINPCISLFAVPWSPCCVGNVPLVQFHVGQCCSDHCHSYQFFVFSDVAFLVLLCCCGVGVVFCWLLCCVGCCVVLVVMVRLFVWFVGLFVAVVVLLCCVQNPNTCRPKNLETEKPEDQNPKP